MQVHLVTHIAKPTELSIQPKLPRLPPVCLHAGVQGAAAQHRGAAARRQRGRAIAVPDAGEQRVLRVGVSRDDAAHADELQREHQYQVSVSSIVGTLGVRNSLHQICCITNTACIGEHLFFPSDVTRRTHPPTTTLTGVQNYT